MDYITNLDKESAYVSEVSDNSNDRPYSQQSSAVSNYGAAQASQKTYEDNEDDQEDESTQQSKPSGKFSKPGDQQMIDISGCEFAEF